MSDAEKSVSESLRSAAGLDFGIVHGGNLVMKDPLRLEAVVLEVSIELSMETSEFSDGEAVSQIEE